MAPFHLITPAELLRMYGEEYHETFAPTVDLRCTEEEGMFHNLWKRSYGAGQGPGSRSFFQISRKFDSEDGAAKFYFRNVDFQAERKAEPRLDLERRFTLLNDCMRPMMLSEHSINLGLRFNCFTNREDDGSLTRFHTTVAGGHTICSCFWVEKDIVHKIYVMHQSLTNCLNYIRTAIMLLRPGQPINSFAEHKLPQLLLFQDFERKFERVEAKMFEFSAAQSNPDLRLDDTIQMEETALRELFANLKKYNNSLIKADVVIPAFLGNTVGKMMRWEDKHMFPLIDILGLLSVQKPGAIFCRPFLPRMIEIFLATTNKILKMLLLKLFANSIRFNSEWILAKLPAIIDRLEPTAEDPKLVTAQNFFALNTANVVCYSASEEQSFLALYKWVDEHQASHPHLKVALLILKIKKN